MADLFSPQTRKLVIRRKHPINDVPRVQVSDTCGKGGHTTWETTIRLRGAVQFVPPKQVEAQGVPGGIHWPSQLPPQLHQSLARSRPGDSVVAPAALGCGEIHMRREVFFTQHASFHVDQRMHEVEMVHLKLDGTNHRVVQVAYLSRRTSDIAQSEDTYRCRVTTIDWRQEFVPGKIAFRGGGTSNLPPYVAQEGAPVQVRDNCQREGREGKGPSSSSPRGTSIKTSRAVTTVTLSSERQVFPVAVTLYPIHPHPQPPRPPVWNPAPEEDA